ncbi:MAG: CHAD domain-containing protein [Pseudomonadota bacterium]
MNTQSRSTPVPGVRKAQPLALKKSASVGSLAEALLRECGEQVRVNASVVQAGGPAEGLHQLRVGLRRLRTVERLLRPLSGTKALRQLASDAQWLGREVSLGRDLGALRLDVVQPVAKLFPAEAGFTLLEAALTKRAARARPVVEAALTCTQGTAFLAKLAPDALKPYGDHTGAARDLARVSLEAALGRVRRRALGLADFSDEERHDLRKALKHLRYAVDLLRPLYAEKATAAYLKQIKALQEILGSLNDFSTAQAHFCGKDAPCRDNPDAQRAVGLILGVRRAEAEQDWRHAEALWAKIDGAKPFWRRG